MSDLNRVKKVGLPALFFPTHAHNELPCSTNSTNSPLPRAQELRDCNKDPETSGLFVQLVSESDLLHWKGQILGPVGTPYEGGKFAIDIVLPSDYPFVPPKVRGRACHTHAMLYHAAPCHA
jgi:ubiquitin-protein ligase